jgi:hypothetical protein
MKSYGQMFHHSAAALDRKSTTAARDAAGKRLCLRCLEHYEDPEWAQWRGLRAKRGPQSCPACQAQESEAA